MSKDYIIDTTQPSNIKNQWFIPGIEVTVSNIVEVPRASLTHMPLANPRAYHRSKITTPTSGINPLLTAASPVFTYINRLRTTNDCDDIPKLYLDLQHEIKAFEAQAQTLGYRSDIILVARYLLCSMLDEIILMTSWGQHSQWHQHKLLQFFHGEDWGGERFFIILKRLSADPAIHIDTLELAYVCLSLGFKGQYHFSENGHHALEQIIEHLYQNIRWLRGDIKKELAINSTNSPAPIITTNKSVLPLWLFNTLIATLLSSFYFAYNFLLGQAAAPLYQQLSSF